MAAATHEYGVWTTTIPNRTPTLIIVSIVFFAVTTVFWTFRQTYRWIHRQRGLDDLMAACAYAVLLIQTVFGILAAYYGFGKHMADIRPTLQLALEYFFLYQICYKLLGGFTKLTFCFLYLRIFNQKGFHHLVHVVAVIVALGSLAFALGTVFQCLPVERAWNRKLPGHCINNAAFWYSHAVFNILFDIIVYLIPIPSLLGLHLPASQKTGLLSLFALGAFVIAAATVRMVMLYKSALSEDPTWGSTIALYWTEIEANTSVICCCLPALRVPVVELWAKMTGKARGTTRASSYDLGKRGGAWSRPQQRQPVIEHGLPASPSQQGNQSSLSGSVSQTKSGFTVSQASNSRGTDFYDRAMSQLLREKDSSVDEYGRTKSQDGLVCNDGVPPTAEELASGGIFKTTNFRVEVESLPQHHGGESGGLGVM